MADDVFGFELTDEQMAKSQVVVIDDEPLITTTLTNFLFVELEIEAVAFNLPREAAAYIESHDIDLVISDFLMPELDGIRLLAAARAARPLAPRVLLTGYADKENAIKAINEVQLYQYMEKPWDNGQLKNIIKNGIERKHLIANLTQYLARLSSTEKDLQRLRNGLVRAFA